MSSVKKLVMVIQRGRTGGGAFDGCCGGLDWVGIGRASMRVGSAEFLETHFGMPGGVIDS